MSKVSEITVNWTPELSERVTAVQIQSRIKGTEPWTEQAAAADPKAGVFRFQANAAGAEIEVRIRNRMSTGVFDAWQLGSIITEDIITETADFEAAIAEVDAKANTAAADAKSAKDRADAAAADNILSIAEKKTTIRDMSAYTQERSRLLATASIIGITAEANDFSTKFNSLRNYLNGLSPVGYTDTSKDSQIDRSTYNDLFGAFVDARTVLIGAIDQKNAKTADYLQTTNTPTKLEQINPAEGTKLGGIQPGATVGATVGTNLKDANNAVVAADAVLNGANWYAVRAGATPTMVWEFTGGTEGWFAHNQCTLSAANGTLTVTASGPDPYFSRDLSISGAQYPRIRALVRSLQLNSPADLTIFYARNGVHDLDTGFKKTVSAPPGWGSGDWCIVEWDMTRLTAGGGDWTAGTHNRIRVDLAGANFNVEVAWIALGDFVNPVVTNIGDGADKTSENVAADTAKVGGVPATTITADIATAKSDSTTARTAATAAKQFADDVADNSKFSSDEKKRYVAWINSLESEVPALVNRGNSLGVTSEASALSNAYTTFKNYLNSVNYSNVGSTTAINRSTFQSQTNSFTIALVNLSNALDGKAATMATWLNVTGAGKPADNAGTTLTLNTIGGRGYAIGNTYYRDVQLSGSWQDSAVSSESCVGNAYVAGYLSEDSFIGLTNYSDPGAINAVFANHYFAAPFSFHRSANGNFYIYETSTMAANLGSGYPANSRFEIHHNGVDVRYVLNGSIVRITQNNVSPQMRLRAFASAAFAGGKVSSILFSPLSQDGYGRNINVDNGRAEDGRLLSTGLLIGQTSAVNAYPSCQDQGNGSGVTISIPGHNRTIPVRGGQMDIYYNGGSIPNVAYSSYYDIYTIDPNYAGGSVTYYVTQDSRALVGMNVLHVSSVFTPPQGGQPSYGSGGGGGGGGGGRNIYANVQEV